MKKQVSFLLLIVSAVSLSIGGIGCGSSSKPDAGNSTGTQPTSGLIPDISGEYLCIENCQGVCDLEVELAIYQLEDGSGELSGEIFTQYSDPGPSAHTAQYGEPLPPDPSLVDYHKQPTYSNASGTVNAEGGIDVVGHYTCTGHFDGKSSQLNAQCKIQTEAGLMQCQKTVLKRHYTQPLNDYDQDGIPNNKDPDIDGDGFGNEGDNCETISNEDQKPSYLNPKYGMVCYDSDNDGFLDDEDNCPLIFNVKQGDIDMNGIGDACETKN